MGGGCMMSAAGTAGIAVTVLIGAFAVFIVLFTLVRHFVRKSRGEGGCDCGCDCGCCSACSSCRPKGKEKKDGNAR